MDDFFTEFKDNLNKRPEPEFDENAWEAMAKKLDRQEEQPKAAIFWWWLLVPFLLLSLFFNGWLWATMKTDGAQQNLTHEIHIDTIYHTKVIYKTDTIVQNTTIIERVPVGVFDATMVPAKGGQLTTNSSIDLFNETTKIAWPSFFIDEESNGTTEFLTLSSSLISTGFSRHHLNNNYKETSIISSIGNTGTTSSILGSSVQKKRNNEQINAKTTKPEPEISSSLLSYLDLLPKQLFSLLNHHQNYALTDIEPIVFKEKRTDKNLSYFFKPKDAQVGANAAWVNPFSNDFVEGDGSAVGLTAMLNFSTPLRLWASFNYYQASYKSYRMADELDIPLLAAPSDEDDFKYAEIKHKSVAYTIGLDYVFRKHQQLKPIIGGGYGIVHFLPQELYYEFENRNTGFETKVETPRLLSKNQFNNLFTFQAGIEYNFWKQWNLQLMASYRTQLGAADLQVPEIFALRAGLFYQF